MIFVKILEMTPNNISLMDVMNPEYPTSNIDNNPLSHENDHEIHFFQLSSYASLDDLISTLKDKSMNFNVLSINICCLNAKFHSLQGLLLHLQRSNISLSAICLQETWIKSDEVETMFNLPGYSFISSSYDITTHGGLAIYLRSDFKHKVLPPIASTSRSWENQRIEILIKGCKNIFITNLYHPPGNSASTIAFIEEFLPSLEQSTNNNHQCIVTGDFNINLLKASDDATTSNFCDSIISSGFLPTITLPTRYDIHHGSATLIDNILVRSVDEVNFVANILTNKISDHYACTLSVGFPLSASFRKNKPPRYIEVTKFSTKNFNKFSDLVSESDIMNKISPDACVNMNYQILEKTLIDAKLKAFPAKRVKFNRHVHAINDWMTVGILNSIKFKDELHFKIVNSPLGSDDRLRHKLNFAKYDKYLKSIIRFAKRDYYHKLFSNYGSDMKKTWATINNVIGRKQLKNNFPESFLINGNPISDPKVIANEFNNFFIGIGEKLAASIGNPTDSNLSYKSFLKDKPKSTFLFQSIDEDQVLKVIDSLKTKNSSGHDNISTRLLKHIKTDLLQPLCFIFNQSISTGIFPDSLKIAKVSPIFKKGDSSSLDNYRPISLLPACSKVLEKILHNQLMAYFTENKLFFEHQYGFRPKHSTELAAVELVDKLLHFMDKKSPDTPICIYMDLSKAFDVLDHSILLDKLSFYGLDRSAITLLANYLSNRKQFVVYDQICSEQKFIRTGVPQGSILGPLLFLIFINDISKSSSLFDFLCYADDTTLISTIEKFNAANSSINSEVEKISNWLIVNKLSLNIGKTKFMMFHKGNKKISTPEIRIRNTSLERVPEFTFLGLTIDENLTWGPHTSKISCKISRVIGILAKLKNQFPTRTLIMIYNSLILPHINYCLLTWGFSSFHRIFLQQKKAIRIISGATYNATTQPLFRQHRVLTVNDIFFRSILKFIYQVENKLLPSFFATFSLTTNASVHNIETRSRNRPHQETGRFTKEYTRSCVRYCYFKIMSSIDDCSRWNNGHYNPEIFQLNFEHSKIKEVINSKPIALIAEILCKINVLSLDNFKLYVKNVFLLQYV